MGVHVMCILTRHPVSQRVTNSVPGGVSRMYLNSRQSQSEVAPLLSFLSYSLNEEMMSRSRLVHLHTVKEARSTFQEIQTHNILQSIFFFSSSKDSDWFGGTCSIFNSISVIELSCKIEDG